MAPRTRFVALYIALAAAGCGPRGGVDPHLDRAYPDKLSGWRLFTSTRPVLTPNAGVLPYRLNTPLFSDYAAKYRTVWMPAGQAAAYRKDDIFSFPVGTILTKTFAFPQRGGGERLIETRLLVLQRSGWVTLPYVWNREQTDAALDTYAALVPVRWADARGQEHASDYAIPNVNQCSACHDNGAPLGLKARNLNDGTQLSEWVRAGYLKGVPAAGEIPRASVWNDPATGSVDRRSRDYLDVNCASCHRPGNRAAKSGLLLGTDAPDPDSKQIAAIVERMESLDPEKTMPSIGHSVVHREAVLLMRQWMAERPRAQ